MIRNSKWSALLHGLVSLTLVLAGCAHSQVRTVQRFRKAVEQKNYARAHDYMSPGARIWYENRVGAGSPWHVGAGTWAAWDSEFKSRSVPIGTYQTMQTPFGPAVWTVVEENNDFYRLTDRSTACLMFTWYLDEQGRINGLLIRGIGEPADRFDEFTAWAKENAADELDYLMPAGKLDPTADRAPRFRTLLNRWRSETGLPEVAVAGNGR